MESQAVAQAIDHFVTQPDQEALPDIVFRKYQESLAYIKDQLKHDLPIATAERYELVTKELLKELLSTPATHEIAYDLAVFQKELGLLYKYKSYTVKATTPLGYSLFLHNQGEGFSYQRHIVHKTEVFHILEVLPGGYVFLCDYDEWEACFDKDSFLKWLAGHPDDRYERYRFFPQPGDVFPMDKLNTVHTVVGCRLEEFATVSTDMVDRLVDQNAGKPIPSNFTRVYASETIAHLTFPPTNRLVTRTAGGWDIKPIDAKPIPGGFQTQLADIEFKAFRLVIEPHQSSALLCDDTNTCSLYISQGSGDLVLNDQNQRPLPFSAGDVLFVPAGIPYQYTNRSAEPLHITEHKIPLDVALFGESKA